VKLIRYRSAPGFRASLAFMLLSMAGILEAWCFPSWIRDVDIG
jgi:hypothetical protein